MSYLKILRKKPKHVRDNIAFGVAGGFTATIALGWLLLANGGDGGVGTIVREQTPLFETFRSQVATQVASLKNSTEEEAAPTEPRATTTASTSASTSISTTTAPSSAPAPREVRLLPVKTATGSDEVISEGQ